MVQVPRHRHPPQLLQQQLPQQAQIQVIAIHHLKGGCASDTPSRCALGELYCCLDHVHYRPCTASEVVLHDWNRRAARAPFAW